LHSSLEEDVSSVTIIIERVYITKNNETIDPTWIRWDIIDFNGTQRPPTFNKTKINIIRRKGEQTCCAFKLQLNTTFTNQKITVKLSYLWQTTVTFTTELQLLYTIQRNHNKIIIALLILLATIIELIFSKRLAKKIIQLKLISSCHLV